MAVSSIKGCWYKFSARIRDYLDVVDAYYRPADDELDGQHHLPRATQRITNSGDQVVISGSHPSNKRHSTGCHKSGNHHHHHHHHNSRQCLAFTESSADNARNQISSSPRNQLPPGYSKRKTSQGQVYFVDPNGHKYWYDPSVPKELLLASLDLDSLVGRLSSTWEVRQTSTGKTYYVNHIKRTTQFTDPRLVAYKDHLMSVIKHIKCNNTTNQNTISPSLLSGSQIGTNASQRARSQNARSSPTSNSLTQSTRTNTNSLSSRTNACSNNSHNTNQQQHNHHRSHRQHQDSDNLRRHVFAVLDEARNSQNNQYQLNLLSSSHHNLSTMTQHSNTLNGPLPSWFPITGSNQAGCGRGTTGSLSYRKQHLGSGNNSATTGNQSAGETNQQASAATAFDTTTLDANHHHHLHSRSMNRSGSISNLILSANSMAALDDHSMPAHPSRTNRELFDKISILRQELLKQQVIAHPCRIDISRKRIFEESFRVVSQHQPRDLKKRLLVKFKGEEGLDYGGVAREWFYLLSREILNPVHGLFQYTSDDIYNLQINPDSGIVYREHLSYMNFCGRVIGMAVFHGHFIEGHFTLPFYKMLLRKSINLADIELVDPELHRSLCWILENDITNIIDTTFLVQHNAFGELQEHELKEDGRNIVVTEENKHEYVSLYVNYRCRRGIASQFEALQRGFYELISPNLLDNFDEHELELLIGGLSKINIEDWRVHTKLKNCTVETPLVRWFWELVKSYSEERRARLLQFVTGSPRVPIQGFKALQGVNSELRLFTIHLIKNACTDNLPKSHTCFNRIDLPPYESYEKLRDKLTQAIEETMGFAMQ